MKNEIILTKELKILFLQVLKSGVLKREQAKIIIEPFEHQMTSQEIKDFLIELNAEI